MYGEISRDKWTKFGEIRYRHYCTCGWGSVPVGTRPLSIGLVKIVHYATSSARFFFPSYAQNYARF